MTYEYKCQKCEFSFEYEQSIHDEPLTKCSNELCDGNVQRVIFANPILFKCGGFKESYTKVKK